MQGFFYGSSGNYAKWYFFTEYGERGKSTNYTNKLNQKP